MMVDVNVSLSRWPFRRLPGDELPRLVEKLGAGGVTQAWVGSFDGLLHEDVGGVNARLVQQCNQAPPGLLQPFGTVNPSLPDWSEDLRRCAEQYRMPGIRLHPNYHGYRLDDQVFAGLLTLAQERRLIVQLAARMEDPRTQHPLMQVPDVDLRPLPDLVAARPGLRLVLLNALGVLSPAMTNRLIATGQVYFELSTLEGVGGIARLLGRHPVDRFLFGSHFPFFLLESAAGKVRESGVSAAERDAILHKNAEQLAAGAVPEQAGSQREHHNS